MNDYISESSRWKNCCSIKVEIGSIYYIFISEGGPLPVIKISVLFKFKLRKLELSYDRIDVKSVSVLK